ncbi:MAG: hypothetical protein IPH78_12270 [Bacteroidetes bacterium]|nr:hypothetical protein [Bacteroidota bacterium]
MPVWHRHAGTALPPANINDFGSNDRTLTGNATAQRYVGGAGNDQHQIGVPVATTLQPTGRQQHPGALYPLPTVAKPGRPEQPIRHRIRVARKPTQLLALAGLHLRPGWEVKSPAAAA